MTYVEVTIPPYSPLSCLVISFFTRVTQYHNECHWCSLTYIPFGVHELYPVICGVLVIYSVQLSCFVRVVMAATISANKRPLVCLCSHLCSRSFMFNRYCLLFFTYACFQLDFYSRWFSCPSTLTRRVSLVKQNRRTLPRPLSLSQYLKGFVVLNL